MRCLARFPSFRAPVAMFVALALATSAVAANPVKPRAPIAGVKAVAAKASVLSLLPEDALAYAVVNRLGETETKISRLTERLAIPAPPVMSLVKSELGVDEGLDMSGSLMIVLMSGQAVGSEFPLVIAPVTDFKKFVEPLSPKKGDGELTVVTIKDMQVLVGEKAGYAIFVPSDHGDALEKVLTAKVVAPSTAESKLAQWINQRNIVGVATKAGIARATKEAQRGLDQAQQGIAETDTAAASQVGSVLGMYKTLFNVLGEEVSHFAVGAGADKDGSLQFDTITSFQPTGKLAKAGSHLKGLPAASVSSLPSGSYLLAFDGALPAEWGNAMGLLSTQMMTGAMGGKAGEGLSAADREKLTANIAKSMKGVKGMSLVVGAPKAGSSIYSAMTGVVRVDNAKDYLVNYAEAMEATDKLMRSFDAKIGGRFSVAKFDHEGTPGLEVNMDFSETLAAIGDPAAMKVMETMFGPGGKQKAYLVPSDEKTVVMTYSKDQINRAIAAAKAGKGGLETDPQLAITAKKLPATSNWIGFLDLSGVVETARGFAPEGFGAMIPPFPKTPPLGFAASMNETTLETQMVVMAGTLDSIGGYVRGMIRGFGGGADPVAPPFEAAPPVIEGGGPF